MNETLEKYKLKSKISAGRMNKEEEHVDYENDEEEGRKGLFTTQA